MGKPAFSRIGLLLFAALAVVLAGCSRSSPWPARLEPVWADGEETHYDVTGRDGAAVGEASFAWRRTGDGWTGSYESTRRGRRESAEIATDAVLRPLRSVRRSDGVDVETRYEHDAIRITSRSGNASERESQLAVADDAIDNDEVLQAQRALPFGHGYSTRYTDIVTTIAGRVPVRVTVDREERVTVPAGTFRAWRLTMQTGSAVQRAWYAEQPPHLLVKYENRAAGSEMALRAWRASRDGELEGSRKPTPVATAASGPPRINMLLVAMIAVVQLPLMLLLPLVLGRIVARRLGAPWRVWMYGAITFVASQVVHLPLNWALGLLGGSPRGLVLLPLPALALAAGLSAGLCEELARYIALRFFAKRARSFRDAVQFGAGHGGVEAMLLGALVAVSFGAMLVVTGFPGALAHVSPATLDRLRAASEAFWSTAWYAPLLGGLERVFAIASHIALSVLVMRAVVERRIGWLLAAIAGHAALDGAAVWLSQTVGLVATEAVVAAFGALAIAVTLALRDRPSTAPSAGSEAAQTPADP